MGAAGHLEPLDPRLARDTYLEALVAAMWASGPDGPALVVGGSEVRARQPAVRRTARRRRLILDALAVRLTDGYPGAADLLTRALAADGAVSDGRSARRKSSTSARTTSTRSSGWRATEQLALCLGVT